MNTVTKIKEKLTELEREKGHKEFNVLLAKGLAKLNVKWAAATAALESSGAADQTNYVTKRLVDNGDAAATKEDRQEVAA